MKRTRSLPLAAVLLAACVGAHAAPGTATRDGAPGLHAKTPEGEPTRDTPKRMDAKRSRPEALRAKPQVGKASIYHRKFAGRRMANGDRMDPQSDNAASKTLPLGTKARVTNLDTGKSAVVTIEDRGPFVRGRIVDLSPATAAQIGLTHKEGLAPVEVVPISVPDDEKARTVAAQ